MTENLRSHGAGAYGDARPEFGVLEGPAGRDGTRAVRAAYIRTPPYPGVLTALTEQEADALARLLAACHDGTRGTAPDGARPPLTTAPDGARPPLTTDPDDARSPLTGVSADRHTAEIFAAAWQRTTGAGITLRRRQRLYRLGELHPPRPLPPGRARGVTDQDHELLARWDEEFCAAVGEPTGRGGHAWAQNRIRRGDVLLRETEQGEPAAMPAGPRRSSDRCGSWESTPPRPCAAGAVRAPSRPS